MKKLNYFLAVICFLMLFAFGKTNAQTVVSNKTETTITISGRKGTFTLSGLENVRITPSGNYLRIISFKLDKSHPLVQLANPVYIFLVSMHLDIDGDGIEEKITDEMAVVTSSGNLKIMYISNGAGNELPPGWNF